MDNYSYNVERIPFVYDITDIRAIIVNFKYPKEIVNFQFVKTESALYVYYKIINKKENYINN